MYLHQNWLRLLAVCVSLSLTNARNDCPVKKPCFCTTRIQEAVNIIDIFCNSSGIVQLPHVEWKQSSRENTIVDKLNLSRNYINTIEKDSLMILKPRVLDLSSNELEVLEIGAFNGLESRLEKLIISENPRLMFPISLVASLAHLRELDVSGNFHSMKNQDFFTNETFPRSSSLETLSMKQCNIESLSDGFFSNLVNLKSLDLSDNELEDIPPAVRELKSLEKLNINGNYIRILEDDTFSSMKHLKYLSLSGNPLQQSSFNEHTFRGLSRNLERLDLSKCDFKHIPSQSLAFLKHLKYLEICDSLIEELPEIAFHRFNSLEELHLCNIERLFNINEKAFVRVESTLKVLSLSGNYLQSFDFKLLRKMTSLLVLDLSGNNLSRVSASDFIGLKSLESLNLERNWQVFLEDDAFDNIKDTLKELNLADVSMQQLPTSVRSLKSLEKLNLSGNRFVNINDDFFSGISPWMLNMSNCGIKTMKTAAFINVYERSNKSKRIQLDVSNNQIDHLFFMTKADIFSDVNVNNNPLICGCHELAISMCSDVKVTGSCETPESVQGEQLGSEKFHEEMMKKCHETIATHKHCTNAKLPNKNEQMCHGEDCVTSDLIQKQDLISGSQQMRNFGNFVAFACLVFTFLL